MFNIDNTEGRPVALGAYIFAGGFTLGIREHFHVLCHLEGDRYGVNTMEHNQPEIPIFYPYEDWPIEELKNQRPIDLIYGNPPCAAWSQANQSPNRETGVAHDWQNDPRVACTRNHFNLLRQLRPKVWVWESVVPAYTKGFSFVEDLTKQARRLGYCVTYLLHDAKYLGVPQKRPRFFFIAHKTVIDPVVDNWETTSVGQAFARMNTPGDMHKNDISNHSWLFKDCRQGENLWHCFNRIVPEEDREYNERGHVKGRPGFVVRRPKEHEPSCTVLHDKVHPTEDRPMTLNELKTLCGFPVMYDIIGSGPVSQISRGVCPPVGSWLGRTVAAGLNKPILKHPKAKRKTDVNEIDLRKPI